MRLRLASKTSKQKLQIRIGVDFEFDEDMMLILLAGVETLFAYTILMMMYSLLTYKSEENDGDIESESGESGESEELIDAGVKWGKFKGREDEMTRFINDAKSSVFSESSLDEVVDVTTFIPIGSANAIASFNGRYTISGRRSRTPTFEVFTVKDVKTSKDDPYPLESSLFIARVHGEDILATFGAWMYWSRHPDTLPVRASPRHYTHLTKSYKIVVESLPCPSDEDDVEDAVENICVIPPTPTTSRGVNESKTIQFISSRTHRSGKVY